MGNFTKVDEEDIQSAYSNNWSLIHVTTHNLRESSSNLDAIFISFNWNKFAGMVSGGDYLPLVDVFSSFLWTAAFFSGMCGLIIDTFSEKFNRSLLEGKAVMVAGAFLFDNI